MVKDHRLLSCNCAKVVHGLGLKPVLDLLVRERAQEPEYFEQYSVVVQVVEQVCYLKAVLREYHICGRAHRAEDSSLLLF